MDEFRKQERRKGTHRETTKFCFLVCEFKSGDIWLSGSIQTNERTKKKACVVLFLSPEDETEKKKKRRRKIKSTKHARAHRERERQRDEARTKTRKCVFFLSFLNRYKKVDDMKARVEQTRTHKKGEEEEEEETNR